MEGIRLVREINDLSLLIQLPAEPSVWDNCAKILSERTDKELSPYLVELLEWLQDLNWLGLFAYSINCKSMQMNFLII